MRFLQLPLLAALSALSFGCSGDASLGNDRGTGGTGAASANGSGGTSGNAGRANATGGTSSSTGGSSSATGGTSSSTGGSSSATGGTSSSTGGSASATGGTGSNAAGTGSTTGGSGGTGTAGRGTTGGSGGTDTGAGGEGASGPTEPNQVTDPTTVGPGTCDGTTITEVIDAIHERWPELASIQGIRDPNVFGASAYIDAFTTDDGFRLVFVSGSGDCLAGCINREYWYFETDDACAPQQVGHYSATYSSGNCYAVEGEPLWGEPDPLPASSICPDGPPPGLNDACSDANTCPGGLTPVKFYGVAGTNGPEFCWCSIPCADDPGVCPTGTTCQSIADGPSNICY